MADDDDMLPSRIRSIQDPFLRRLGAYLESETAVNNLDGFFMEYMEDFRPPEGNEHSLENHELYQKYLQVFSETLEGFMTRENMTEEAFFAKCESSQEEDENAKKFLRVVLGAADYDKFVALMLEMQGGE
mmetsp:Transcript_23933/g.74842  ORF Transcript_23933/g.74842 Transcript_23933/m.74842 type:complete len:130 (+) Transcript_23933:396-785(+)